jgi:hypothetical protein
MRIPDQIEMRQDNEEPVVVSGAELAGAEPDDVNAPDGALAMHRHFAECIRDGVTPSSDVRDVINTSHLVDRLAGNG